MRFWISALSGLGYHHFVAEWRGAFSHLECAVCNSVLAELNPGHFEICGLWGVRRTLRFGALKLAWNEQRGGVIVMPIARLSSLRILANEPSSCRVAVTYGTHDGHHGA